MSQPVQPDRSYQLRPNTEWVATTHPAPGTSAGSAQQNPAGQTQCVIYVMSRDQRVHDNQALAYAQNEALQQGIPVVVYFNLVTLTHRSRESYEFMLQGLREVDQELQRLGIPFIMRHGSAAENICVLAQEVNAQHIVLDFNPLQRARDTYLAQHSPCAVTVVDTHNVIPTWVASDKSEFAAHTFRPKVHRNLAQYLVAPEPIKPQSQALCAAHRVHDLATRGLTWAEVTQHLHDVPAVGITIAAPPGATAALHHTLEFCDSGLGDYALGRNDIVADQQSGLSPYLHFGHVSSLRVALEALKRGARPPLLIERAKMAEVGVPATVSDGIDVLLEEMIVRKELADNYCFYQPEPQSIMSAASWAQATLDEHRHDQREYTYDRSNWERAATHDPAWNAAQNQMRQTGKMHGYMRMYWAKKMLEWSVDPETAIADCIYLNDKYSIDGGDPNGYAGIMWSIAGVHDRAWAERAVFGKIRYMNAGGLARKFNLNEYLATWEPGANPRLI